MVWRRWAGPAALAAVFALLSFATWLRWTDGWVDFGAELYFPWRMTLGESPYVDFAYRNGPLSPHLNSLWFRLFGVSIRTLALCNLAILGATGALVFRAFRPAAGTLAAALCGVVFFALFGFGHLIATGNFNWITPYQHPQTHGAALSVAWIVLLHGSLREVRTAPALGAGVCLGLVLLTKAELMVPALAAAAAAVLLVAARSRGSAVRLSGLLFGGALLPIGLFAVVLASQMPLADVARGLLGNWAYVGDSWASDPFYRVGSGLHRPLESALVMASVAGLAAVATAVVVALDRIGSRRRGVAVAVGVALFLCGVLLVEPGRWLRAARGIPLLSGAVTVAFLVVALRPTADSDARLRAGGLALWGTWATSLLAKIVLNARLEQYGFVLAMPATLLLVAVWVGVGPRILAARWPGGGRVLRAAALGLVCAGTLSTTALSWGHYSRKTYAIGSGADRILVEPKVGSALADLMARVDRVSPPGASLLVLPEGALVNYWLRRPLPSRHYLFIPTELAAHGGERAVLEELQRNPPAVVALAGRDYHEFGGGSFGSEPRTGQALLRWVQSEYCAPASDGGGALESRLQTPLYVHCPARE